MFINCAVNYQHDRMLTFNESGMKKKLEKDDKRNHSEVNKHKLC